MSANSAVRVVSRSVVVSPPSLAAPWGLVGKWRLTLVCAGVLVATLALYVRTAAPTIYALDSSGLTRAAVLVQPAHPPGYPLYVVLGKLFSLAVPVGDMGYRLNLMSAFFAALTLATLVGLLVVLGCRPVVGAATALLLGGSYYFWSIATMAEVYALQAFLTVALVLALVLWRADGRWRWLLLAALLLGLALSNHLTTVLLVPGIAVFGWLVLGRWPAIKSARSTWLAPLALLAFGPMLYMLLPLRGDLHSVGEVVDFALAHDFWQAVFAYSPAGYAHELVAMAGLLWANFLGAGIVLGLVGLAGAAARDRELVILVGGGFLASFMFFSGYEVADKSLMLAPVIVLWAVWVGLGLDTVLAGLDQLASRVPARWGLRLGLMGAVGLIWALNFPLADLSQDRRVRQQAEAVLAAVAENAVVLVGSWVDLQPLLYLQDVEGERPDVELVDVQAPAAARAAAGLVDVALDTRPVYAVGRATAADGGQGRVWLVACGCYRLVGR